MTTKYTPNDYRSIQGRRHEGKFITTEKSSQIEEAAPVMAFKGFDENMQCRGFQFEAGKTYEQTGEIEA